MQNESKNKPDNYPLQLALKTRICLMAALIYGGTDCTAKDSVSKAVEISKEVDTQVREMKAAATPAAKPISDEDIPF